MKATHISKCPVERKMYGDKIIAMDLLSILDQLEEVVNKFNGAKCFKVDGSKTKAFNDAIKAVLYPLNNDGKRVYFNTLHISSYLSFSNWMTFETFTDNPYKSDDGQYIENDFYFGKKEGQIWSVSPDWKDSILAKCGSLIALDYADTMARLKQVEELIKTAKNINDNLPYYARLSLPYVK